MKIILFRCDTVDRVRAAAEEAARRLPPGEVALVCQSRDTHFFTDIDAAPVTFEGSRLDGAATAEVLPRLAARLGDDRERVAVIPVRNTDPGEAAVGYANIVALCRQAGITRLVFCTMDGGWHPRSLSWARSVPLRDAAAILLLPLRVILAFFLMARSLDRRVLSLTPEPVDWLCHVTKVRWARRVGWLGVAPDCYLGNPFSLVYPPLSLVILGALGVAGTSLLMGLGQWLGLFWLAALARSWPMALVAAFLLGSPLYKYAWVRVGRIELLGWAFATAAWGAVWAGAPPVAAGLLIGVALLCHPFSGAFGGLLSAGLSLSLPSADLVDVPVMGATALGVSALWWIPFVLHGRKKLGFRKLRDGVPVLGVDLGEVRRKALALGTLTVVAAVAGLPWPFLATLGLLLGLHGLLLATRSYLFHPFSLDLASLMASALATALTDSWPVAALALLVAYASPSVGPRAALPVRPTTFAPTLEALEALGRALPRGARVACEFSPTWTADTFWSWLRATAWADLGDREDIAGVSSDQVEFELPFAFEQHINLLEGPEALRDRLVRLGASHLASYSEAFTEGLRALGAEELARVQVPAPASLSDRTYTLFASPWPAERVSAPPDASGAARPGPGKPGAEPDDRLVCDVSPNRLAFDAPSRGRYLVRYAWYAGWRASDAEGRDLPLSDAHPGMWLEVAAPGRVTLSYRWRSFFLAPRRDRDVKTG